MTLTIDSKYDEKVQKIMANLPTSQFVVDLVGEAIKVSEKEFKSSDFERRLDIAYKMSVYAKEVSQPMYYKTHLVVAPLVAGLEASQINRLETASGTLSKACAPLGVFVRKPFFKDRWHAMFELSKVDVDVLAAAFMFATEELRDAVTHNNLYVMTGFAYIEVNIRQSGMFINHTIRKFYNEFASIVLNQAEF